MVARMGQIHHGRRVARQDGVGQGVDGIQVFRAKDDAVEWRIKLHAATEHLLVQTYIFGGRVTEANPHRPPACIQQQITGAKHRANGQFHRLHKALLQRELFPQNNHAIGFFQVDQQ